MNWSKTSWSSEIDKWGAQMTKKDNNNIEKGNIEEGKTNYRNIPIPKIDQQYMRSEEVQEIVGHKSGPLERWALWIFLGILLLVIISTGFIHYPDILNARATLTSQNGPKDIVPFQSGRLTRLFADNGTRVKSGEAIAYMESAADADQILSLSKQVEKASKRPPQNSPSEMSSLFMGNYDQLGEVQSAYQTFIIALQQFNDYFVNGFYQNKKKMLGQDLTTLGQMTRSLELQRALNEKDSKLAEENHEMNRKLYEEKIISSEEYRQDQSKLLGKQMTLPQVNSSILSNQNQQRDKMKEMEQLNHDIAQQKLTLGQALQTLKSALDAWKKQYILLSPENGILYLTRPYQQNQYVQAGRTIGYVSPMGDKLFAEIYLPQDNLGKADIGMEVQLRFDAYPYQEKGIVRGKLDYISRVVSDSGYLAIVRLDDGLKTSQHERLAFKDGLKADALIITKDQSLLQRLYYSIIKGTSINR